MTQPTLGLVMPLYNEQELVRNSCESIFSVCSSTSIPIKLLAVNNGSTDNTAARLRELKRTYDDLEILNLKVNHGYGGGILAGLERLDDCELVGWVWGDNQIDAKHIPSLYSACINGADVAKCVRTIRQDGPFRAAQSRGYRHLTQLLGAQSADLHGTPKLFRRKALRALAPRSTDWFLDTEIMLKAEHLGLVIYEESATMRKRQGGQSKIRLTTSFLFLKKLVLWKLKQIKPNPNSSIST